MKSKKKVPQIVKSPNCCEVPSCSGLRYQEGLCPAHFKLSHDPFVRIAFEDFKRRQELDRLTGKKVSKVG